MVFLKTVLPLILLGMALPMHTVFYSGQRFVNRNGNVIDCFGDMHIACHKPQVCSDQQQHIIDRALACDACVIVEDMDARYKQNPITAQFHFDTGPQTPLDNLSMRCDQQGVSCVNVEFREESAASLGGLPIPSCDALHTFHAAAFESTGYNDCHLLNAYYWRTVSSVLNQNRELIDQLQGIDCSLHDYCQDFCEHTRQKINLFDARLIDMRILHSIYENRLNPSIFVCAGSNHIERIKPMLRKLGYKSMGGIKNEVIMAKKDRIDTCSALSLENYFELFEKQNPYVLMVANRFV